MLFFDRLALATPLDLTALGFLILSYNLIGWRIEHPSAARPSVSVLMADYRHEWMTQFITRDVRIFDAQILASLRQGTTFFASTCILAIGGTLALLGNTAPLSMVAVELGQTDVPVIFWQFKLIIVVLFLTNGFLKFAWANRMFGYFAVLLAAIPNDPKAPDAPERARQAAEINVRAARNFNRGLRSIYFALGAIAWLAGPIALLVATAVTIALLWEREFYSGGHAALVKGRKGDVK